MQFAEMDFRRVAGNNFGGNLAPAPVKENNPVRWFEAQDVAAMMRFGACQDECVGMPICRRDIKAMHAGSKRFLDFAQKKGLPKKFFCAIEEAFAERSVFVAAESGKFFELLALLAVQTARHLD
jgi:hypothetical protein